MLRGHPHPAHHHAAATATPMCSRAMAVARRAWVSRWKHIARPHRRNWNNVWLTNDGALAYVENQKAASRTLLKAIGPYKRGWVAPYRATIATDAVHAADTNLMMALANRTVFTFVRDPIVTFLSGADEVFLRWTNSSVHEFGRKASRWPKSFAVPCSRRRDAIVEDVQDARSLGKEAFHIFPQALKTDVLPPGRRFDFVGRVERLTEDIEALFASLAPPHDAYYSNRWKDMQRLNLDFLNNSTDAVAKWKYFRVTLGDARHPLNCSPSESQPLSSATSDSICGLMAADFACFGYTCPSTQAR